MPMRSIALLAAATMTAVGLAVGALAAAEPRLSETGSADAAPASFAFREISGGQIDLAEWRGSPILVVNTASRCGFTRQYDDLQALYDRFRDAGLIVLGVPSNAFGQELTSADAVRDFCEVNFSIDFPMTDIVELRGPRTHPFYEWAARQGVVPRWNFHKILLDVDGRLVADFPTQVSPLSQTVVDAVERLLPRS